MVRLWNWFKDHPALAGVGVIIGAASLIVSIAALARDASDWTISGSGSGRQALPTASALGQVAGEPMIPSREPPTASAGTDVPAESSQPSRNGSRSPGSSLANRRADPETTGRVGTQPNVAPITGSTTEPAAQPQSGSRPEPIRVSMTTTNYIFLGTRPITTAPDNPHEKIPADLQSGPGSLESRSSTDFASAQGDGPCQQAELWTRDRIELGRGSVVDFCLRLGAMRPIKYFKVHLVVSNSDIATINFSDS